MIVEHEVIEQTETQPDGRPLPWVCDLIRQLGRTDPMSVLKGMVMGEYLSLADTSGRSLPVWQCAELFRTGVECESIRVHATLLGSQWVHG